ncbi:MAG: hypothetical protein M1379_08290 [Firmicutes bacterium]|nr:hypothetical protein [Bacillota bacterium]
MTAVAGATSGLGLGLGPHLPPLPAAALVMGRVTGLGRMAAATSGGDRCWARPAGADGEGQEQDQEV